MTNNNITIIPDMYQVEILEFARGLDRATIATNGDRHVAQIDTDCIEYSHLRKAIVHLETIGYHIITDQFRCL